MYINYMMRFSGASRKVVLCNFLKMLMVLDEMLHKTFRTHTTLFINKTH